MAVRGSEESGQLVLSLGTGRRVYSVAELSSAVQTVFERNFTQVWVSGEISGCKAAPSGHWYFALKDADSQLKCVLFRGAARLLRFKPQDGLAILARGSIEVYQARGEYQLVVEHLELSGVGSLQIAFDQVKRRLAEEGLFDADRKKPLPVLPRRIGLVTSLGGSVLHDMLQVLGRRFPGLHIRIYPAQVQGEASVEQICTAIQYFSSSAWADVVIVARGGGSLEDLWSFNEERVARAISACLIPTISAVGHETDFTISDFVADCRAPTPSAAAEIVICTRESLLNRIAECESKALRAFRYRLLTSSRDIHQRGYDRALVLIQRAIAKRAQHIDDADLRLVRAQERRIEGLRRRLQALSQKLESSNLPLRLARNRHRQEQLAERFERAWKTFNWQLRKRIETATAHLGQLSPLAVLERGYAIVENSGGQVLRASAQTTVGEELQVRLREGKFNAVVSSTEGTRSF